MIEQNPFLGPTWMPLVRAIRMLLGSESKRNFHLNTYGLRYKLSPDRSPYIQATWSYDGQLQLEASGNLSCNPPLTEEQFQEMEFIGWTRPEITPEEYGNGEGGDLNPNFVRFYDVDPDLDEVADFFLTTLTAIYGITEKDYFNFGEVGVPDQVAALGGLIRLKKDAGNPNGSIFGLMVDTEKEIDS
jgi:hypothetical protein